MRLTGNPQTLPDPDQVESRRTRPRPAPPRYVGGMYELKTERLVLRGWRESDIGPWAAMNADPEVRRYFSRVLTPEESAASAARFQAGLEERGWGWGAVEVVAAGEFIGLTGLDTLDLPEVLAVTAATNLPSRAVMRRIGMTHDPAGDFDDPEEPEGPLRRNVLYRLAGAPR
ncbi:N-acetyltransferase [Streptomyces roseochromogenus]|nr:N-acetyltransferase [Streptomyces roseochromogenus]